MKLFKRLFESKKPLVTVFCGAREGKDKGYAKLAYDLGIELAKNDLNLLYGAGGTGLMGKVAYGVLDNGGDIFGVTTKIIADFEKPIKGTKNKIVKNIQVRKKHFVDSSDAFIILPGGFGTFDELFDMLVVKEIYEKNNIFHGYKNKKDERPVILINYKNFFDPFVKLIDSIIKAGFMNPDNRKYFKIVETPKAAIAIIKKNI